jgi:hypothetical protein
MSDGWQAYTGIVNIGSRIMSDGWQAYTGIVNIGNGDYSQDVIINQKIFVHLKTVTFTHNLLKELKRMHGTSETLFQNYLRAFVWRSYHKNKHFPAMRISIKNQYALL